jgi:hypothetical protein
MTKSIPTLAAALLMTAIDHPNADVLAGRPSYRSFDQSSAYYVDAVPMRDQRQIVPRHHRKVR